MPSSPGSAGRNRRLLDSWSVEFQAVEQGVELRYVGELAGIAEAALQVVRVAHRVGDESIDQRRGRNRLIFDLASECCNPNSKNSRAEALSAR